jgi:hypothetical protein
MAVLSPRVRERGREKVLELISDSVPDTFIQPILQFDFQRRTETHQKEILYRVSLSPVGLPAIRIAGVGKDYA